MKKEVESGEIRIDIISIKISVLDIGTGLWTVLYMGREANSLDEVPALVVDFGHSAIRNYVENGISRLKEVFIVVKEDIGVITSKGSTFGEDVVLVFHKEIRENRRAVNNNVFDKIGNKEKKELPDMLAHYMSKACS